MIDLPVYNKEGEEVDRVTVDESVLGGRVRPALIKQALVMYQANKRMSSATTKSRGMVIGSTRKIFRQKGTGNARMGSIRTNIRRGGGVAFAKQPRSFRQHMPAVQKRLARDSALLAKMQSNNTVVIDFLAFDKPKTKEFVAILKNLKIERSCLVTLDHFDSNIYKSLRNIPKVFSLAVEQLNAGDICKYQKLLMTRKAIDTIANKEAQHAGKSD
ncbi:MAG: 50S ribosomal protein L4 [Planctomycetes bacterium]|nr:50S ribosomal protein L4 [Planctomycetota bacterium]